MRLDYQGYNDPYKVLQRKQPIEFDNQLPCLDQLSGFLLFAKNLKKEGTAHWIYGSPVDQAYFLYNYASTHSKDFISKL